MIHPLLAQAPAAARAARESEFWQHVMSKWGQESLLPVEGLVIGAAVLVSIVSLLWLYRWYQQRKLRSTPLLLFHQVASELGLTISQEWLLLRIARRQGLSTPLTLLMSAATLDHHAAAYAQDLMPRPAAKTLAKVARIRQVLVGAVAPSAVMP